ncbi:hypothetical protein ACEQ8H_008389 [Pleosporales sp. CAS-2024a]
MSSNINDVAILSDECKQQITSILASCTQKLKLGSRPAPGRNQNEAAQPNHPSFTMADAWKYLGHSIPMWISFTNDDSAQRDLGLVKLVKASSTGRFMLSYGKDEVAFDTIDIPRRVPTVVKSESLDRDGTRPAASQSLVIRRKENKVGGDGKGKGKEKGEVIVYLRPVDNDAIGTDGDGWFDRVMVYVWARANE